MPSPVLLDSRGHPVLPVTSMLRALEKAVVVALTGVPTRGTRLAWVLRWVGWQPQALPELGGTFSMPPWDVS